MTNQEMEDKLLAGSKSYRTKLEKSRKWRRFKIGVVLCCVCFCCCVVLPILLISNFILFMVLQCESPAFDQVEHQTFAASDLNSLLVNLVDGNIALVPDPSITQTSFTLELRRRSLNLGFISPMNCDVQLDNGTLSVKFKPNWVYFFSCPFTHVSMFIPSSFNDTPIAFNTVQAHTKIGSINVTGVIANKVDLATDIGDLDISQFKGDLVSFSATANDGAIRMSDIELMPQSNDFVVSAFHGPISGSNIVSHNPNTTLRLTASNGDCSIDGFEGGSVVASQFSGNFKLRAIDDTFAGTFELSTLIGSVRINGTHISYDEKTERSQKGTINGGGQQHLQAATKRGDVSVELIPAAAPTFVSGTT